MRPRPITALGCAAVLPVMLLLLWQLTYGEVDGKKPPPGKPTAPRQVSQSKPSLPREAGLSESERRRLYLLQVIGHGKSWYCRREQVESFQWPSPSKALKEPLLYKAMEAEKAKSLGKWLRLLLQFREKDRKVLVEKGRQVIYLYSEGADSAMRFRVKRDTHDITKRYPYQVDVLRIRRTKEAELEPVIAELAACGLKDGVKLKGLPKTQELLRLLPLSQGCTGLPWELRSFSVQRDCKLIGVVMRVRDRDEPLDLTVWAGTKGIQGTFNGKGVQALPRLILRKDIRSGRAPWRSPTRGAGAKEVSVYRAI